MKYGTHLSMDRQNGFRLKNPSKAINNGFCQREPFNGRQEISSTPTHRSNEKKNNN
jgi:hypothetical protein